MATLGIAQSDWYVRPAAAVDSPYRSVTVVGSWGEVSDRHIETAVEPVAAGVRRIESPVLAAGVERVRQQGADGQAEVTRLVETGADGGVLSSNVIERHVTRPAVDKVIEVGAMTPTPPKGEMQTWAHDLMVSRGYNENDWTMADFIITRESGWNPAARNPSGAYGLPQAMPGDGMPDGADWRGQFEWFLDYCNGKYGSVRGAYEFWLAHHWY